MSQNDLFSDPCHKQEGINTATCRVVMESPGGKLLLEYSAGRQDPDLAYDIRSQFTREERKLCPNVDKAVSMITQAIETLLRRKGLKIVQVPGGSLALAKGSAAPDEIPSLRKRAKAQSAAVGRSDNRIPFRRPMHPAVVGSR